MDDHSHYVSDIDQAVHQADFDRLVARVRELDDKVGELERQLRAEQEVSRALQGAMTARQMAQALRDRAGMLARDGQVARGQHPHDFAMEIFLQHQLLLLASEVGG